MNAATLLLVALGGAIGSVARFVLSALIPAAQLPWGTIAVNVAGSLLIGLLMGRLGPGATEQARLHALAVVGFCGGFTTFSAFSWQTLDAFQRGHAGAALLNILLSTSLCLAATWMGWRLVR